MPSSVAQSSFAVTYIYLSALMETQRARKSICNMVRLIVWQAPAVWLDVNSCIVTQVVDLSCMLNRPWFYGKVSSQFADLTAQVSRERWIFVLPS
jgi:hypothetical protein